MLINNYNNMSIRELLKKMEMGVGSFFSNFGGMCVSILRICALSSVAVARQSKNYSSYKGSSICYVLGNGPSLKEVLKNGGIERNEGDLFCVNMFCSSEYFWSLHPRFYLLCDGQYFNPTTERTRGQVKELIRTFNKIDWSLFLIVPPMANDDCELLKGITNPKVSVLRNNSAEVDGFRWFRHFIYKHRMGMPRCQTVINYALMTAINMEYKIILLYGADHSWSKDMWVGEDNKLYTGDPHLYKNEADIIVLNHDIASECYDLARAFETHKKIRLYADSHGARVINKTKGSFIDAYDRR